MTPYEKRLKALKNFLKRLAVLDRAIFLPLHDPYGPAASSRCLDAIVVSEETKPAANEINLMRQAKGLPPLEIITIKMVLSKNGIPISTTRIRQKKINHEGQLKPSH